MANNYPPGLKTSEDFLIFSNQTDPLRNRGPSNDYQPQVSYIYPNQPYLSNNGPNRRNRNQRYPNNNSPNRRNRNQRYPSNNSSNRRNRNQRYPSNNSTNRRNRNQRNNSSNYNNRNQPFYDNYSPDYNNLNQPFYDNYSPDYNNLNQLNYDNYSPDYNNLNQLNYDNYSRNGNRSSPVRRNNSGKQWHSPAAGTPETEKNTKTTVKSDKDETVSCPALRHFVGRQIPISLDDPKRQSEVRDERIRALEEHFYIKHMLSMAKPWVVTYALDKPSDDGKMATGADFHNLTFKKLRPAKDGVSQKHMRIWDKQFKQSHLDLNLRVTRPATEELQVHRIAQNNFEAFFNENEQVFAVMAYTGETGGAVPVHFFRKLKVEQDENGKNYYKIVMPNNGPDARLEVSPDQQHKPSDEIELHETSSESSVSFERTKLRDFQRRIWPIFSVFTEGEDGAEEIKRLNWFSELPDYHIKRYNSFLTDETKANLELSRNAREMRQNQGS